MLQLDNLKSLTGSATWKRGEDYFYDGLVKHLRNSGNRWKAIVEGSYNYRVAVTLDDNAIEHWECNCPYDYGPVCKHVVALALTVSEKFEEDETNLDPDAITVEEQEEISGQIKITNVPAKDLKQFCEEYARQHPNFARGLVVFLAKPVQQKKINYAQKIRKAAEKASDRNGFIDYYRASDAFEIVFKYLDKAKSLLQKKDFGEVLEITKAVFEEVSDMCQYMDDSDGMAGDSLYDCQELLYKLFISAPEELKLMIYNWLLTEYPKKKYQGFLGDEMLLDLLIDAAKPLNKTGEIFQLLNQSLENSESEYIRERILLKILDLISFSGKKNEKDDFISKYIYIPEIRRIKLEELIKEEKYSEAEQLIIDGIEIARQKMHHGKEIEWHRKLMDIYYKTGNKNKQRELIHILFKIDPRERTSHLKRMKMFYPTDFWIKEREKLVSWLKEKKDRYLFDFYVFEKMWHELFLLLKKNPHFHLLKQYGHLLMKDYGENIIEMYDSAFMHKAQQANNRNMYRDLKKELKSVKKLKGGPALVNQLVSVFRKTYKNRPAMMDELSGL